MYLPIKVNGRGLIPRGHGLAPKNFVKADEVLVQLIMQTPGLSMEYIHPDSNTLTKITRTNYQELFAAHEAYLNGGNKPKSTPSVSNPAPVNPPTSVIEKKEEIKKEEPKVEVKPEPKDEKKEEKKDFTMKPIHKEDKK